MRFGRGRGQQRRGGNPIQILLRRLLVACLLGFATAAVAAEPPTYRIGPGDVLEIPVWREPELSTAVTVRPDGRLSFPLVEDLPASGRTPMELAEEIAGASRKSVVSGKRWPVRVDPGGSRTFKKKHTR